MPAAMHFSPYITTVVETIQTALAPVRMGEGVAFRLEDIAQRGGDVGVVFNEQEVAFHREELRGRTRPSAAACITYPSAGWAER